MTRHIIPIEKNTNDNGRDAVIDLLRGIAALMVVVVHVFGNSQVCSYYAHQIAQFGQLGVQLFFVLSAYTLSNSLDKSGFSMNVPKYFAFLTKRYFRIAPLFYFGLMLYFLVRVYFNDPMKYTFLTITSNLLLLHGIYLTPASSNAVPGGWSVGAEFLFYMIFPFLYVWVNGNLRRFFLLALISICIAIFAAKIALSLTGKPFVVTNNGQIYMAITSQFSCFVAGMFAYYLMKHLDEFSKIRGYAYLGLSLLLSLCLIDMWFGSYLQSIKFLLISSLSGLCFLFLLCGMMQLRPAWASHFSAVGERSYSIYIVHFVFVYFFARSISNKIYSFGVNGDVATILTFILIATAAFLVAGLTFKLIEKPFIKKGSIYAKKFSLIK